jgi:hypothetical protein
VKYFEYVARLQYDEDPDYEYCRKLLENGLKHLKCSLQGKLDFSGKESVKRSSPRIKNSPSLSNDNEAQSSDTKPYLKKKGVVASGTRQRNQGKEYRANFYDSISSAESDNEQDHGSNYNKRLKLNKADKKSKTTSASSWRNCPSVVASNVHRAGEYTSINDKKRRTKKQKETVAS